jgi:hypothetical protein
MQWVVWVLPIVIAGALFYIFNATSPNGIGPGGVLITFVLIYALCLNIIFIFLHTGLSQLSKLAIYKTYVGQRQWNIGVKRAYYIASILAFAPVLLLGVQSIGQLDVKDVILVVVFMALATVYIVRRVR